MKNKKDVFAHIAHRANLKKSKRNAKMISFEGVDMDHVEAGFLQDDPEIIIFDMIKPILQCGLSHASFEAAISKWVIAVPQLQAAFLRLSKKPSYIVMR